MKCSKQFSLMLIILFSVTSCYQSSGPVADFEANNVELNEGQAISFNDLSTGDPVSWEWTFEGGNPSQSFDQHPQDIFYLAPGVYDVTLYVENEVGEDELVKMEYITVHAIEGEKRCGSTTSVTDIDGNVYPVVQIGDQCWMAEDLRTTHYANGNPILNEPDNTAWKNLTTGAWCYYLNQSTYDAPYGKLYNFYAVSDARNICPAGWHVPTDEDWKTLETTLGMSAADADLEQQIRGEGQNVGGKMKTIGTTYWDSPNTGATNASNFTAVATGFRFDLGQFDFLEKANIYWTATTSDWGAYSRELWYNHNGVFRWDHEAEYGLCVRCVRD